MAAGSAIRRSALGIIAFLCFPFIAVLFLFPPPSFNPLLLLFSSLLTTGPVFLLANFIVLAILISSGSLRPSTLFASTSLRPHPNLEPLSRKFSLSDHPHSYPNDVPSKSRPVSPPPFHRQSVLVPGFSQPRIPDRSHLHLVQNLPFATAKQLAIQHPKQAFYNSAATAARLITSTSDQGVLAISETDLEKTLRKVETMNSVSLVFRPLDCGKFSDATDPSLISTACLSPDDFHKKCEDFIAKAHSSMKSNVYNSQKTA